MLKKGSIVLLVTLVALAGCQVSHQPDTGHRDFLDMIFGQRHTRHVPHQLPEGSLLAVAREVTQIEDAIRRDGSITVKQPDVWGEGNLMHSIQEYEQQMATEVGQFKGAQPAFLG
jgi:hypothetical protein